MYTGVQETQTNLKTSMYIRVWMDDDGYNDIKPHHKHYHVFFLFYIIIFI